MTKIGFIGLGIMGHSMAQHLLEDYPLYVYNRTQSKADDLVASGAHRCQSPADLVEQVDVVLTILGYPGDVKEVYLGEDGLLAHCHPGQIMIDLTTSSPSLAEMLYQKGQDYQVDIFDAPVSGGDIGARQGRLSVMVGGPEEKFDQVKDILSRFASQVTYFGPAASGQHAKLANQIMVAGTMLGMCEALAYGNQAGLDLEDVITTLSGGAAANFSLVNYGPRILKDDYSPGFFVKHFIKDLGIALEEAEKSGLQVPMTQLASLLYTKLADQGMDELGSQALMKLWWK